MSQIFQVVWISVNLAVTITLLSFNMRIGTDEINLSAAIYLRPASHQYSLIFKFLSCSLRSNTTSFTSSIMKNSKFS